MKKIIIMFLVLGTQFLIAKPEYLSSAEADKGDLMALRNDLTLAQYRDVEVISRTEISIDNEGKEKVGIKCYSKKSFNDHVLILKNKFHPIAAIFDYDAQRYSFNQVFKICETETCSNYVIFACVAYESNHKGDLSLEQQKLIRNSITSEMDKIAVFKKDDRKPKEWP